MAKKKVKKTTKKKTPKKRTTHIVTRKRKAVAEKKKVGRPGQYLKRYAEEAYKLCLLGATDKQLAEFFGISEQALNNWKGKHPRFLESLKAGKKPADAEVAYSLFQRACGYEHPEDKIFHSDATGLTIVEITKHYPPDTGAAFIWLKNRAGWQDKVTQEVDVSNDLKTVLGLIDGSTQGKLPAGDSQDSLAGQIVATQ